MLDAGTVGEGLNVRLNLQQTTNRSTGLFLAQASIPELQHLKKKSVKKNALRTPEVPDAANSSAFRDMLWIH